MTAPLIELNPARFKNIKTVFLSNIINGACMGFYNVLLQPYIVQFVKSESKLGMVFTIASIFYSAFLMFTSSLSDKKGRKTIYLSSILLIILAMVLYSQAYHISMVVGALLMMNMGSGLREPALQALIAESSKQEKMTSSFSFVNITLYGAGLVGPILINLLSGRVEIRLYFYGLFCGYLLLYLYQLIHLEESLLVHDNGKISVVKQSFYNLYYAMKQFFSSLFIFISLPYYLIVKRRTGSSSNNGKEQPSPINYLKRMEHEIHLFQSIFEKKGVRYALGFFILDAFVWGISLSIFRGSTVLIYGFNESHIALFDIVFNVTTIIFFIPATLLSDRLKKREILVISEIMGSLFISMNIVAYFTLPRYRLYAILIGWFGLGGSVAFWVPGILSILTSFDPHRRAEVYGTVSGLQTLGWFPTALIAGLIIESTSLLIPFLITIAFLPIDIFIAWRFPEKTK